MNPDPINRVTMKSGSSMESKVTWVSVCKVQIIGLLGFWNAVNLWLEYFPKTEMKEGVRI